MFERAPYPPCMESAVQRLCLFNWEGDLRSVIVDEECDGGWLGPRIGPVLTISPDLREWPRRIPPMPDFDDEPTAPYIWTAVEEAQADALIASVQRVGTLLANIRKRSETRFIRIALRYLRRAYMSRGNDQFLSHIFTLDALTGNRGGGRTKRLARRVATILGESDDERRRIEDRVTKLYDFRSALVHGDEIEPKTRTGHLREARSFARRTLLWFLNAAVELSSASQALDWRREDLLRLLDSHEATDQRLKTLLGCLPRACYEPAGRYGRRPAVPPAVSE